MKKHIKLIISAVVIIFIAVGIFYKYKSYTYSKKVAQQKQQELKTDSSANDKSPSLVVGDNQIISMGAGAKDTTNKKFKWSSSDPSVAAVDENGAVKAVKPGKATITAVGSDGSKKTYVVNVKGNDSSKLSFNVETEYSPALMGSKVAVSLNGVAPSDLSKYSVKYDGKEVKLYPQMNSFRLFVHGNIDVSTARSKITVK